MNAKIYVAAVFAIAVTFLASGAFGAQTLSEGLLRDGHVTGLVQGRVVSDANGLWFFELAEDVNDMASVAKEGTRFELLPSRRLEQLSADIAGRDENTYLLKGRLTRYKGRNYIYPEFFRAVIVAAEEPEQQPEEEPTTQAEPNEPVAEPGEEDKVAPQDEPNKPAGDADNTLEIPQDVLDRMNSRRVIRTRTAPKPVEQPKPAEEQESKAAGEDAKPVEQPTAVSRGFVDTVLIDRMAFLDKHDDGGSSFVLDAYGLTVGKTSLKLLPSQALEITETMCAASMEPVRFKIAGIRTHYKGQDYLLLQRAARIYSHGNFRAFTPQYR